MEYDKLIENLKQIEYVAYNHNINGEVLGMDCVEFESVVADAATTIETFRAENEKLREKVEDARLEGYAKGLAEMSANLARVTAERDAIEQDFRAFTKQWWEEVNGFPCRFCKFENSGGCEQKAKHPDDEKPCAGRWFEWCGIKKED